jgi:hypothetical protein
MKLEKLGPVGSEIFWSAGAELPLSGGTDFNNKASATATQLEPIRPRLQSTVSCVSLVVSVCRE